MSPLRWGAIAAVGIGLSLPATAIASGAKPASSELCGNVSVTVGSNTLTSPVPPACTSECFIVIGPVSAREGGLGVNVAPCIEG